MEVQFATHDSCSMAHVQVACQLICPRSCQTDRAAQVLVWNLEDHGGGALLGKTAAGAATHAPTAPRGQSPALAARATLKACPDFASIKDFAVMLMKIPSKLCRTIPAE